MVTWLESSSSPGRVEINKDVFYQHCALPRMNQTYQKLLAENEELQVEHKSMKSQLNSGKLEQTQLESELSKLKEQNQQLEIATIKLTNQCEVYIRH